MIRLNFLWHQHQPDYRRPGEKLALLPWVRLHAVKGYLDLLSVLERYDDACCTVNFSGILLEQLLGYQEGKLNDYYAELTLTPPAEMSAEERTFLIKRFFSANRETLLRPHRRYRELLEKRDAFVRIEGYESAAERFTEQELTDLQVWFNLAWIGFTGKKQREVVDMIARGRDFDREHCRQVLEIHKRLLSGVISGYRKLAEAGQIELSFTPYQHPILPLIVDLAAEGHRNQGDPLPGFQFPGDAKEHVERGMHWYEMAFGMPARGAWPAEGSVSDKALGIFSGSGLNWVATDQQNLPAGIGNGLAHMTPYQWQQGSSNLAVFFRDTRLADNIGFEYASWKPALAGSHLVKMVQAMASETAIEEPVVTIALDGENPWETYPDGGEGFLGAMFEEISAAPDVECTTPSRYLAGRELPVIGNVSAGSWIMGNFDIWSRHPEARTAWRRLAKARNELLDVATGGVYEHLLAAEGSDWFWWYGDDFSSEEADLFDSLFREHLIAAYQAAKRNAPDEFSSPIKAVRHAEYAASITALIEPQLDGKVSNYYEWLGAVQISGEAALSAMARSTRSSVAEIWYGFGATKLFLRLDFDPGFLSRLRSSGGILVVHLSQGDNDLVRRYRIAPGDEGTIVKGEMAFFRICEIALPLDESGIEFDALAYLHFELELEGEEVMRVPKAGRIPLRIITEDFAARNWLV